ncbi:hypothetical protein B5E41_30305 [Rhizobium esperanzae]|uniref:Short-chain dehydrogenase n=1 Tax=Rhizobium esperanzae TaxID=1967781 RepID=A0A246DKP8_9HYPH|nr:SDR family NAD(P)-dependent oxidoreductase [Rhizobium esperanzae]OWO89573.1 hypothetical protein B5E41_30305 [Rhizobium esperanzae]
MTTKERSQPRILVTGVGGSIGMAIISALEAGECSLIKLSQKGMGAGDLVADFGDDAELANAVGTIPGALDGIVLAHGMLQPGPLARVAPLEWRRLLDVNLNSLYTILHSATPKLQAGASIVLVSSTAGFDHSPVGGPHYTVSKWAINGLVRHLASELGSSGIRINAVCPGWIDNPMGRAFLTDAQIEAGLAEIPLKRAGTPSEVASVIKFLLSDEASYVTGALLPVSGGVQ